MVGQRAGMSMAGAGGTVGQLLDLKKQIEDFSAAAEQIQKVASQFEGMGALVLKIDEARQITAAVLHDFSALDYELTKNRFVSLRMHHHVLWGDYDTSSTKTKEERALELVGLEESFRAEYDAIQALVLLVTRHNAP